MRKWMKTKRCRIIVGIGIALVIGILMYTLAGYVPVVGKYVADAKRSLYSGEKVNTRYVFPSSRYAATWQKTASI